MGERSKQKLLSVHVHACVHVCMCKCPLYINNYGIMYKYLVTKAIIPQTFKIHNIF